jgi:hypothetical protein
MIPWVNARHAESPESIDAIKEALTDGWVVGLHFYLGGACSPDGVAFAKFEEYQAFVSSSRAGDKFTLWSVGALLERKIPLAAVSSTAPVAGRRGQLRESDLGGIESHLAALTGERQIANEVLVAVKVRHQEQPTAFVVDIDGFDQITDWARRLSTEGGELYVLPLRTIEAAGLCLLNVKRANDRGEIPLVGAY